MIKTSVQYELQDARWRLQKELDRFLACKQKKDIVYLREATSESGVRFGISSANASDNHTYSCLEPEGGLVLNASIHLRMHGDTEHLPVVSVKVELMETPIEKKRGVLLESEDNIAPAGSSPTIGDDNRCSFNRSQVDLDFRG